MLRAIRLLLSWFLTRTAAGRTAFVGMLIVVARGAQSGKVGFNYHGGNVLAAMLAPGRIEIPYHEKFSDERVTRIVRALLAEPRLAMMRSWQVIYQGRPLRVAN